MDIEFPSIAAPLTDESTRLIKETWTAFQEKHGPESELRHEANFYLALVDLPQDLRKRHLDSIDDQLLRVSTFSQKPFSSEEIRRHIKPVLRQSSQCCQRKRASCRLCTDNELRAGSLYQ